VAIKESMQQHEWLIERQQLLERIKELEAEGSWETVFHGYYRFIRLEARFR